jgi:OHCU decarboxylase
MSQSINRVNELSNDGAQAEFLKCCGSKRWARMMSEARPFANLGSLIVNAGSIWFGLSREDWLEAFSAHPKIGGKKAAAQQPEQAQSWSAQEQSGLSASALQTKAALAAGNEAYEERFGFIFIVCATGKSAEEMLSILNERMGNDRETELLNAAEEQAKITALRLAKLLESLDA